MTVLRFRTRGPHPARSSKAKGSVTERILGDHRPDDGNSKNLYADDGDLRILRCENPKSHQKQLDCSGNRPEDCNEVQRHLSEAIMMRPSDAFPMPSRARDHIPDSSASPTFIPFKPLLRTALGYLPSSEKARNCFQFRELSALQLTTYVSGTLPPNLGLQRGNAVSIPTFRRDY